MYTVWAFWTYGRMSKVACRWPDCQRSRQGQLTRLVHVTHVYSMGILDLREDAKGGVQVAGLSEVTARSTDEVSTSDTVIRSTGQRTSSVCPSVNNMYYPISSATKYHRDPIMVLYFWHGLVVHVHFWSSPDPMGSHKGNKSKNCVFLSMCLRGLII